MAAILVALLFVAVLVIYLVRKKEPGAAFAPPKPRPAMRASHGVPQGAFVHDGHAWARLTPDGVLRVGIDGFLADALGDAEAIELPPRGATIRRGEPLLRVKSAGRWIQVPAPADGKIMWAHDDVVARPWMVTLDPYGTGWAVALRSDDLRKSLTELRTGPQAVAFLRAEVQRLVEFLSRRTQVEGQAVLADGALPFRGAASDLDDESWSDFCTRFASCDNNGSSASTSNRSEQSD